MSHVQRSEGLCSVTFCSCCIRPERTTDCFLGDADADAMQNYLQMQLWKQSHTHTPDSCKFEEEHTNLINRFGNSRASKSPLVQNCEEMQPWIESDHNCQFAADSQRASLGLHHHASFQQHSKKNESITKSIPNLNILTHTTGFYSSKNIYQSL